MAAPPSDDPEEDLVRAANARAGSWVSDKWQLEAVIGLGGTGAVYRARHRNGSMVAIKVMHAEHLSNNKHTARFFREALFANRIEHEAVLKVFDDGMLDDGCPYLVTELLYGQTLEDERIAAGGTLPVGTVTSIGLVLLDILEKAHAAGLVHRDLKPVNLFRTKEGKLKVLDFGLGRDLFEKKSGPHKLTSAFVTMGTVGFMAPEQAKGKQDLVNPTTDLWALGATLLMLATGLDTHDADSPIEALGLAAVQPVAKTASRVQMPLAFCEFLDKAMAFEQRQRFPSARAMRVALKAVHDGLGPEALVRVASVNVRVQAKTTISDNSTIAIATPPVSGVEVAPSLRAKRLAMVGLATGVGALVLAAMIGIGRYRTPREALTTEPPPASSVPSMTQAPARAGIAPPATAGIAPTAVESSTVLSSPGVSFETPLAKPKPPLQQGVQRSVAPSATPAKSSLPPARPSATSKPNPLDNPH